MWMNYAVTDNPISFFFCIKEDISKLRPISSLIMLLTNSEGESRRTSSVVKKLIMGRKEKIRLNPLPKK